MIEVSLQVRLAVPQDQRQIANLMFFEMHVHRHLDWRAPLDWLGSPYFWVLEENDGRILAVLACPQNLPGVAWVRLFTHVSRILLEDAWTSLWRIANREIAARGGAVVAVIAMHDWLAELLYEQGFVHTQNIVMLEWNGRAIQPVTTLDGVSIRNMTPDDLPGVAALDSVAFAPLWQNPLDALTKAFSQATLSTVVEDAQGLAGYQISTSNPFGTHLARLAVRPEAQRRGLGAAIVADLTKRLNGLQTVRLTVNTQSDNYASLALYQKMGFIRTGEQFPIYCYQVPPLR